MGQKTKVKRVELHAHLGSAVNPAVLWTFAHRQGIKLPTKDFWEFSQALDICAFKMMFSEKLSSASGSDDA